MKKKYTKKDALKSSFGTSVFVFTPSFALVALLLWYRIFDWALVILLMMTIGVPFLLALIMFYKIAISDMGLESGDAK